MKEFMKKNKLVIILVSVALVIGATLYVIFSVYNNENTLTVEERNWIDENASSVLNVNILNNVDIFGNNSEGVYFDFLEDFSLNYNMTLNPITFNVGESVNGLTFTTKNNVSDSDLVFYKDNYVLVGKNEELIINYDNLDNKTIGVLSSDFEYIQSSINNSLVIYESFENETELTDALNETLSYMIVPLNIYLDVILQNNYTVLYHFSDINYYFVMESDNSVLASVMKKYYNSTWNELLYSSYKENEFNSYVNNINITEIEIHELRSVIYNYGLLENSPYELIEAGEFGGISAVIMKEFSDFAGIEFNFEKYDNVKKLSTAVSKNEIDMYLNNYNFTSNYKSSNSGIPLSYEIIVNRESNLVIESLNSLEGKEIYVEENSRLYNFANSIKGAEVKTYESGKVHKLNNENVIIIIDSEIFEVYNESKLNNYTSRYNDSLSYLLDYKINSSEDTLSLLFSKYINLMDTKKIINEGINNYYETSSLGSFISMIARYIIILVVIAAIILFIAIKKSKQIKIAKKIKKDDKMKFIDQLTSLKNRNYLNECIDSWDNNTIYPQAIILANLNSVQKLNDQYGYNEGDRQIKSFANALIKTQLDNSEVMRTDGNEFVIYLIGYNQKQITNYIHKLNKEVEKLPYENGAKFGYSMILDNLKTIEDCLNEASSDMKEKKNNEKGK